MKKNILNLCACACLMLKTQLALTQTSSNEFIQSASIIITDTIDFEGVFILDAVTREFYLIEKEHLNTIRLQTHPQRAIKKFKKSKHKLQYMKEFDMFGLFKKYHIDVCHTRSPLTFLPYLHGMNIGGSGNTNIWIGFLSISLVEMRISKAIAADLFEYPYLQKKFETQDYVTVYTPLFCR